MFLGPQENEHTTLKVNELAVLSLPSMQRAAHQQISIQSHFLLCFMFSCLFNCNDVNIALKPLSMVASFLSPLFIYEISPLSKCSMPLLPSGYNLSNLLKETSIKQVITCVFLFVLLDCK